MKSFSFKNQGTNTYLIYTISEEDNIDSMSLGMLTNNKIPGLAPAIFTQMDTTKLIKYNVTSHISVKQFFADSVNKKRLVGVFTGIVDAMLSAEDYMIDITSIIMNLNCIFVDVSTCKTILICLPIINAGMPSVNLGIFFKNIMFNTQFDQSENCDYVAKIMNYLNSTEIFSLADFKKLLSSIYTTESSQPVINKPQPIATPMLKPMQHLPQPITQTTKTEAAGYISSASTNSVKVSPVTSTQSISTQSTSTTQTSSNEKKMSMLYLLMNYSKENLELYKAQRKAAKNAEPDAQPTNLEFTIPGQQAQPIQTIDKISESTKSQVSIQKETPIVPQSYAMNFGETTVLSESNIGETTVLGGVATAVQMKPYLIRTKNNEKINLDKPIFKIGKEKSYVDYFIGDNAAISRSHANFISRESEYFVVDTNSTNHTYVNGTMIQSNVEIKLSHDDNIRLANESFDFKMY